MPIKLAGGQAKHHVIYHTNPTRSMQCVYARCPSPSLSLLLCAPAPQKKKSVNSRSPQSPALLFSSSAAQKELIKSHQLWQSALEKMLNSQGEKLLPVAPSCLR